MAHETNQSDHTLTTNVALDANLPAAAIERLRSIAVACGVPVREDADLAELLKALDDNNPIPVAALAAVAEILSQVNPARRRTTSAE